MASKRKPDLSDYVEVNERIEQFYKTYPEGSLSSQYLGTIEYEDDGQTVQAIIVQAKAYRTADDPRPGVGLASEPLPGKTPYTKDSELMNAETSAWGRALAALGFEVKRSIASREEVRNRSENVQSAPNGKSEAPPANSLAIAANKAYAEIVAAHGKKEADRMVKMKLAEIGIERLEDMSTEQAQDFFDYLSGLVPAD